MSYGRYTPRTGKLSTAEKKRRAETRRENKIKKEWSRTSDLYDYDIAPRNAFTAEGMGLTVYWSICKNGHIGEFTLSGSCKQCQRINRGIRDARTRGTQAVKLTKSEKNEISKIYAHAKRLTKETGVEHHVDHIMPLVGGGEHHPSNLRVITAQENMKKGGKFQGKKRTYSRNEKKEQSERLAKKRDVQLKELYEEQYKKAVKEYQARPFLIRLFTEKPKLKIDYQPKKY